MFRDNISEAVISVAFLVLIVLFINPFGFIMPDLTDYILIASLLVVFAIFAGLFWREAPKDERESLHRAMAARFGYVLGVAVLVLGIIIQTIERGSGADPWLAGALAAMVIGKLAGIAYSRSKH